MKHRKNVTKNIIPVLPKGDMIYPLMQANEIPAIPIVEIGEIVLKGQKIAEASSVTAVPIFATVSGKVKSITNSIASSKWEDNCIVIENDGEYREVEFEAIPNVEEISSKDILNRIANSGIVYEPSTGLSLHAKLSTVAADKLSYVVIDVPKIEEVFTGKDYKAEQFSQEIIEGMNLVLRLFENAKGICAIEKSRKECIHNYKALIKLEERIELQTYKNTLDTFEENEDCLFLDVDMLVGIHDAVLYGMPIAEKIVAVVREGEQDGEYLRVLLGTNLKESLDSEDYAVEETWNLAQPIMQVTSDVLCARKKVQEVATDTEEIPVKKEITNEIWYLIAALPMLLFGVYKYNMNAVVILFCSVWTAIVIEGFWSLFTRKSIVTDYRKALAAGVLFGLTLPAKSGWLVCIIGVGITVAVAKYLWVKQKDYLVFSVLVARCIVAVLFYENTAIHMETTKNVFDLYVGNVEFMLGGLSMVVVLVSFAVLLFQGMVDNRICGMYLLGVILTSIVWNRSVELHHLAMGLCNGALLFWGLVMTSDYRKMIITNIGKVCCGLFIGCLSIVATSLGHLELVPFVVLIGPFIRKIEHMLQNKCLCVRIKDKKNDLEEV